MEAFETIRQPRLRLAIHQPNFLPRLKVLQKIATADIWCVLDSVQYCAREWQNRTRIVEAQGHNNTFWFSIPVHRPHGRYTPISEVTIVSPSSTPQLMQRTLLHAFRRTPYWAVIDNLLLNLEPSLSADSIGQLCVDITCLLLQIAGRQPTVLYASSFSVAGKASALMAAICGHLNATAYLADSGARNYLQPDPFNGIDVLWQNWHEPTEKWPGISKWRDISSLNYLARVGPKQFKRHILGGEFTSDSSWLPPVSDPILDRG